MDSIHDGLYMEHAGIKLERDSRNGSRRWVGVYTDASTEHSLEYIGSPCRTQVTMFEPINTLLWAMEQSTAALNPDY